jgi:hypothetical protein
VSVLNDEEIRVWAKKCVAVTHGIVAESVGWEQIAERGHEWGVARWKNGKPFRGGPMLTPKRCFTNAARIRYGLTSFDPAGCQYAEGFTEGFLGLWYHHAWVINAAGLVIERTWQEPGTRYVGVTFDNSQLSRAPGQCQLSDWPFGIAMGPDLVRQPEAAELLRSGQVNLCYSQCHRDNGGAVCLHYGEDLV